MVEKVVVSPLEVRGLGDVVSSKSVSDFLVCNGTVSSGTDSNLGTVFSESYKAGSSLTLSNVRTISSDTSSFTVTGTLKDSSDNAISGATVYLDVNGTVSTGTTNSSGVVSWSISNNGSDVYHIRVYYLGSNTIGGSFANTSVVVSGEASDLELRANKSVIQTGDVANVWATLLDSDGDGVPFASVNFYEEWTPGLRTLASKSVIQSGTAIDLSAQLIDAVDGSLVRESGHRVNIGIQQDTVTMFKGNETFNRVGTGTGTLNISYTDDKELVYTAASGILFHSDLMFQSDGNWECTFKFKATGTDGGRFGIYRASSTDSEKEFIALKCQRGLYLNTQTGTESMTESRIAGGYSSYQTLKVIAQDDNAKIYLDGTLKKTVELNWLYEPLCFGLNGWTTGNVIYVKDFKFKESE